MPCRFSPDRPARRSPFVGRQARRARRRNDRRQAEPGKQSAPDEVPTAARAIRQRMRTPAYTYVLAQTDNALDRRRRERDNRRQRKESRSSPASAVERPSPEWVFAVIVLRKSSFPRAENHVFLT